jgi:MFS family permease
MKKNDFDRSERKLITGISLVLGMRMMGVSFIIPIFSIYATGISGTTETLAGIAVGIFGLTQTLFQVPMGGLSDRWGRKNTTIMGLLIYLIGTLICGISQNIYHLIIGRLIAGAGAVTGVTMAWLTDGIDISRRNSALSYVGIAMGTSVILGFTLSPIIAGKSGIPFLFYLCAAMIFISIVYIFFNMRSTRIMHDRAVRLEKESIWKILKNRDLIRLNITGFFVNLSLNGVFFMMPLLIHREMPITDMWMIFVPMALIGTGCMFFITQRADTKGTVPISTVAFVLILAGTSLPVVMDNLFTYIISFILFYSGFCSLQPLLPAAVSRYPNMEIKGVIMSFFNSCQFIGSGAGGLLGGIMLVYHPRYLFIILTFIMAIGLITILGFKDFKDLKVT